MLKLSSLFIVLAASAAVAHPGKTDYQDGHKCLKNCEDWDLNYDEYHLHDKDRNAIRLEGRKKAVKEPASVEKATPAPLPQEVLVVPVPLSPESKTEQSGKRAPVGQKYSMPVEEEGQLQFSDILLFGIAGLLLLVMIILRRKREQK